MPPWPILQAGTSRIPELVQAEGSRATVRELLESSGSLKRTHRPHGGGLLSSQGLRRESGSTGIKEFLQEQRGCP